jgi:hypothetical protein
MAHLGELACRYPYHLEYLPLLQPGGYERA